MENSSRPLQPTCSRWHDIAYWLLLLVACVVFFVLNTWTSFKEDDMEFSLLRDAGFVEFWRAQLDHYLTSNGRCADFFATLFCAFLGKPAFNVINTLVFGLLAHLVSLLSTGRRSVMVLAMFVAVVGLWFPVPGQTMLFVAGSFNYMWAITASLSLVYLLQRFHGKRLGKGRTALVLILALVAGNLNEATSFGFFAGMVLYYIFNRDKLDRLAVMALGAYLVGVLLIVASPAAWARVAFGDVKVNMGFKELLMSRSYIFAKMMVRIVMPALAVLTGLVVLFWKGVKPIRRCLWTYVLPCLVLLMFALGYLYDRAYAPMTMVAFLIVAMALDALLARCHWGRLAVIVLCLAVSGMVYPREMKVLHELKAFEDNIDGEIRRAPRHVVLHEYRFPGSGRFATPLRYVSTDFFNREPTYCAYYDKDNVQFVSDSVYERYHSGRLLDGATLLPLVSDRPDVADTVLSVPGQDYMVVVLNVDTLPPTLQIANYYLAAPDKAMSDDEKRFRGNHGLSTDFEPRGFYPLYYQGKQLLVFPLIDDATSHIVFQLDYNSDKGEMTLSRKQ
ncbi:MAG: hypothetical protein IKW85_10175 [Muribaculaceae bacterium]|nr:hypothetical protein [Muribaculaceae bacterium]